MKKLPSKIGNFLKENPGVVTEVLNVKLELINNILEYKKAKMQIEVQSKALDIKKMEIKSNEILELEKLKRQTEIAKQEFEMELRKRDFDHREKMRKLEIIYYQLKEGNELIKQAIMSNKDLLNNKDILETLTNYQLEIAKLLRDF